MISDVALIFRFVKKRHELEPAWRIYKGRLIMVDLQRAGGSPLPSSPIAPSVLTVFPSVISSLYFTRWQLLDEETFVMPYPSGNSLFWCSFIQTASVILWPVTSL